MLVHKFSPSIDWLHSTHLDMLQQQPYKCIDDCCISHRGGGRGAEVHSGSLSLGHLMDLNHLYPCKVHLFFSLLWQVNVSALQPAHHQSVCKDKGHSAKLKPSVLGSLGAKRYKGL